LADTRCLPLEPLQAFSQQDSCDTGKDNGRDRFPNQILHELIELGVGHRPAQDSNSSASQLATSHMPATPERQRRRITRHRFLPIPLSKPSFLI
jgi:hypothetical protein